MKDKSIFIIQQYIRELRQPCRKKDFMQRSYSLWAAIEILKLVLIKNDIPPIMVVEEFRNKIDGYSLLNSKSSIIFSIAYDTATDILDNLL